MATKKTLDPWIPLLRHILTLMWSREEGEVYSLIVWRRRDIQNQTKISGNSWMTFWRRYPKVGEKFPAKSVCVSYFWTGISQCGQSCRSLTKRRGKQIWSYQHTILHDFLKLKNPPTFFCFKLALVVLSQLFSTCWSSRVYVNRWLVVFLQTRNTLSLSPFPCFEFQIYSKIPVVIIKTF